MLDQAAASASRSFFRFLRHASKLKRPAASASFWNRVWLADVLISWPFPRIAGFRHGRKIVLRDILISCVAAAVVIALISLMPR